MKGKISDKERLNHINDAINDILNFTNEVTFEEYQKDYKLRLALTKLFEIIGEASNKISEELKSKFTEVEWKMLNMVRNVLVHAYFGIDYNIMWETIKNDMKPLKAKIENILNII
jgi:uncharacterized protein with HEPN domain